MSEIENYLIRIIARYYNLDIKIDSFAYFIDKEDNYLTDEVAKIIYEEIKNIEDDSFLTKVIDYLCIVYLINATDINSEVVRFLDKESLDNIYYLFMENEMFALSLINSFFDQVSKNEKVTLERMLEYNTAGIILKFDKTISVSMLDDNITKVFFECFEALKQGNLLITPDACELHYVATFFGEGFDGHPKAVENYNYLKMYREYLFRIMLCDVYSSILAGKLEVDSNLNKKIDESIINEDYNIWFDINLAGKLVYYFYLIHKTDKLVYIEDKEICKSLRRINPLYRPKNIQ